MLVSKRRRGESFTCSESFELILTESLHSWEVSSPIICQCARMRIQWGNKVNNAFQLFPMKGFDAVVAREDEGWENLLPSRRIWGIDQEVIIQVLCRNWVDFVVVRRYERRSSSTLNLTRYSWRLQLRSFAKLWTLRKLPRDLNSSFAYRFPITNSMILNTSKAWKNWTQLLQISNIIVRSLVPLLLSCS